MLRTNKLKMKTTDLIDAILIIENNKVKLSDNESKIVMKLKNRANTNKNKVFIDVNEYNLVMDLIK